MSHHSTIVALSSGAGKAGVAVIRLSGPLAFHCVEQIVNRPVQPGRINYRDFEDPASGGLVDRGLVLTFPAPRSFTGEDVAEFHVHGSPAVVGRMISLLCAYGGVVPAGPGEFTRRAFENGKLDLSAAEGLADLIEAETEAQRQQAQVQMDGAFADHCEVWGESLRRGLAWLEAAIDFPDEELPEDLHVRVCPIVHDVLDGINAWLAEPDRGRVVRDGFRVAIIGPPNAGKSSLLNQIARRDVAIVSETAGTTRDVIEVRVDLEEHPVVFVDTAGLREEAAVDSIEREGMARALAQRDEADLVLRLVEVGTDIPETIQGSGWKEWIVANKIDTGVPPGAARHAVSALTGQGIERLLSAISTEIRESFGSTEHPALTRERHRHALEAAAAGLDRAAFSSEAELIAEDLRLALRAFERLIGRTDAEDLLDLIFRDFCIGK